MYSKRFLLLLGLPSLIWILLFVVIGVYALFATGFGGVNPLLLIPEPHWSPLRWTLQWVNEVAESLKPFDGQTWIVFLRTCLYVAIATCGCVLIGYPVAYYTALHAKRSRAAIILLLILPFLVSYMLRMLAWIGLLSANGWINDILLLSGVLGHRVNWLAGHPSVVVVMLIYGWIPYFIIAMLAGLMRFDRAYIQAARDLGANSFSVFIHVTLPISRPGLLAAIAIILLPMFGDFFTNVLVSSSPSTSMVGTLLLNLKDSPDTEQLAAAASVFLMVFLTALLIPYVRSSARVLREGL